jgi:hypothetical protein
MIVRVIGTIYQYSSERIAVDCLQASVGGLLIQTPFDSKCLNGFDYIIVFLMAIIGTLILVITSNITCAKLGDLFNHLLFEYMNIVKYSVNGETFSMREDERYSEDREKVTVIRFDCEKRKFSKKTERSTSVNFWRVNNHFSEIN